MIERGHSVSPSIATDPHSLTHQLIHFVGTVFVIIAMVLVWRLVRKCRQRGLKPLSAPDARRRIGTSLALIAVGFIILVDYNYFIPGEFSLPLGYSCLAAMATGLFGSLYYAWSWYRLHSIAKRSASPSREHQQTSAT